MAWTNNVVMEFLELYKSEPLLWEPKHPLHRSRSEVTDAWIRIQASLSINVTVVELKKKKESLMTSFRMHYNKKKKAAGEYKISWFAYPVMESFLAEKYDADGTNNLEQEFCTNSSTYITESPVSDHQYTGRNLNSSTTARSSLVKQPKSAHIHSTDFKANVFPNSDLQYTNNKRQIDDYSNASAGSKKEIDEYDLYGQLLAKKLRKLDEHQRDVAMHDIDNIMFRAKMKTGTKQAQQQSRSYSSSPSPVPRKLKSPLFIVTTDHTQYEDENIVYQEDPMQANSPL